MNMSRFPTTQEEYLKEVARETARMSYPGGMSRGEKRVLKKSAKTAIKDFFVGIEFDGIKFDLNYLWDKRKSVANQYDDWHKEQAEKLNRVLKVKDKIGNKENEGETIAAKLIDTFMYQLMKYEQFRFIWNKLHLPLDRKILGVLSKYEELPANIIKIIGQYKESPYKLPYEEYRQIQKALWKLVKKLNKDITNNDFKLKSRIQLNLLWSSEER